MFDECSGCGEVRVDATVEAADGADAVVVCPSCAHREPIHREPLLVVSGAGGTGKSTALRELRGTREDVVLLDSDTLWRAEFWEELEWYVRTWLRLCRDVAQSKRPPVLFGAGFGVPASLEAQPQYECFSAVHYLVLRCDEDVQRRRLRARPPGRHSGEFEMDEDDVAEQVEFGRWLRDAADREGFETVDTTDATAAETAARVDRWITERLDEAAR